MAQLSGDEHSTCCSIPLRIVPLKLPDTDGNNQYQGSGYLRNSAGYRYITAISSWHIYLHSRGTTTALRRHQRGTTTRYWRRCVAVLRHNPPERLVARLVSLANGKEKRQCSGRPGNIASVCLPVVNGCFFFVLVSTGAGPDSSFAPFTTTKPQRQ